MYLDSSLMGQTSARVKHREPSATVLGAGLAGLSTAYTLKQLGYGCQLLEKSNGVGGLARTIEDKGFRFDLGGHRFITNHELLDQWIRQVLFNKYVTVQRSSRIYRDGQLVHYPLKPLDAMLHVGPLKTMHILLDYLRERVRFNSPPDDRSLETWVQSQFGNSLYQLFFKGYSEKVWGMDCRHIDRDWISERIQNLSLIDVVKDAVLKIKSSLQVTLADEFLYPSDGIGVLPQQLAEFVGDDSIQLNTQIKTINHDGRKITGIHMERDGKACNLSSDQYISSIPVPVLLGLLRPLPPAEVLQQAKLLRSRDLILVTLFIDKENVTKDSWIYFPDKRIPFGRIHEPKNWSAAMAPEGQTSLVTEHFCDRGDAMWLSTDTDLIDRTRDSLVELGYFQAGDVVGAKVIRLKDAYPLFDINYKERRDTVFQYLDRFTNLSLTGRTGLFRYYNMDTALLSGMEVGCRLAGADQDQFMKSAIQQLHSLNSGDSNGSNEMRVNNSGVAA